MEISGENFKNLQSKSTVLYFYLEIQRKKSHSKDSFRDKTRGRWSLIRRDEYKKQYIESYNLC